MIAPDKLKELPRECQLLDIPDCGKPGRNVRALVILPSNSLRDPSMQIVPT